MHFRLPEARRTTFRASVLDLTFQSDVHSELLWWLVLWLWRRVPGISNHLSHHLSVPALILWAPPDKSTPAQLVPNCQRGAHQALSQPQAWAPSVVQLRHVCSLPGVSEVYILNELCHLTTVLSSTKSLVLGLPIRLHLVVRDLSRIVAHQQGQHLVIQSHP